MTQTASYSAGTGLMQIPANELSCCLKQEKDMNRVVYVCVFVCVLGVGECVKGMSEWARD